MAKAKESAKGAGTGKSKPASKAKPKGKTKSAGVKILVVEDNPALSEIMTTFLDAQGFTVVAVGNGLDAVQSARQELPALILMDLQLPVMSGLEAMRRIRHIPELSKTPIIAITGFATDFDAARAKEAGCDVFMHKPYDLDAVLANVQKLLA